MYAEELIHFYTKENEYIAFNNHLCFKNLRDMAFDLQGK